MWQRFELFWTAFEKFALFFSFLGTLTGLMFVAMIYQGVTQPEAIAPPTPMPTSVPSPTPPINEIIDTLLQGFGELERSSVTTVTVPISYSIPIVLEVHIHPETTRLELTGVNKVKTDDIAIKFSDDVGWLLGNEALITFEEGEAFKVKMDVKDQIEFDVPIQHDVQVPIPGGVDLEQEMNALQDIGARWNAATTAP